MANIKQVHIIVDTREDRSLIATGLEKLPGVTIERKELASGDFIISPNCAVERKSARDFLISVMEGRMFDQIARMQIEYEHVVVMIEGNPYETRSNMAPEAIDGALSYLSLLSGVKVMFSPNVSVSPRLLWRMSLHMTHGLGYEISLRAGKPKELGAGARYLIEGLPGVGPSMAKTLLSYFGSPYNVFTATVDDLVKVKGVGKLSAEKIVLALRASV